LSTEINNTNSEDKKSTENLQIDTPSSETNSKPGEVNKNNSTKPNRKPNPFINKKKKPESQVNWFFIVILVVVGLLVLPSLLGIDGKKKITQDEFFNYLKKGYVTKVEMENGESTANVFLTQEGKNILKIPKPNSNLLNDFQKTEVPDLTFTFGVQENFEKSFIEINNTLPKKVSLIPVKPSMFDAIISQVLVWGFIFALMYFFIFRKMGAGGGAGGQIFNIGRSRAKLFDENDEVKITFNNVAGLEGAKEEIEEIVEFLKNPEKFTKLGGKIPKGALLVGPPGTGKTLLAKAVAGEAKVPFFSLSGSDFVEMFVGVGASRVRDLFHQAKVKSPAIIFIDEIDAIGRARGKGSMTGGNDERENTLNQLLTEMDGFGTDTNVIVMAATNRADVLDKALMRAGRFDRTIFVDLPDLNEREAIFKVHLIPLKLDDTVETKFLARQTPGFSGADIANICNEAALIAARKNKESIGKQDFLDAVDRIIGGLEKKNKIIKPHERKRVAYHEAGHATISWLVEHAAPLVKVTIVPRGRSLGAAWYMPDERQLTTTDQMNDELCATLGGRAAEEVTFGNISTGALSDLERVTKQVTAMVTVYGLNPKVGNISYYDSSGQNEYMFSKPYSENTAKTIDEEISKSIEFQYKRAIQLLKDNQDKLNTLAELLLEKEVIFKEDLETIFGKRLFEEEIFDAKVVNNDGKTVIEKSEEIIQS